MNRARADWDNPCPVSHHNLESPVSSRKRTQSPRVGAAPRAALVMAAISRWLVAATGGGWQADAALKRKPETGTDAAGISQFR